MKIVIVGSGNVGFHLADLLVKEGHDITVIDSVSETLSKMIEVLDVIGVHGNGSYYAVQMEADVPNADLLIAVTQRDEVNMLCCLLAKKLGAKHTIARIRDYEYEQQLHLLADELGLSMSINPESAAASEIARILKFPSALKVDTMAKGLVELVHLKLNDKNPLVGRSLKAISDKYEHKILISAVERHGEVYMPTGSYVLRQEDRVHIIGKAQDITRFFKSLGLFMPKSKYVLIVGGGQVAFHLAQQILAMGMQVKIIEHNMARCIELCEYLPQATVIHGDGTDQDLLIAERLTGADSFIALTGNDETNLIISMFAKSRGVSKVITKIRRSKYIDVLRELDIDTVISKHVITSNTIAQYVRAMGNTAGGAVETLYKFVGDKAEAIEFIVTENTRHLNTPLRDLNLKDNLLIAALVRGGEVIIPGGGDIIKLGDHVIVVTTHQHLADLNDIYGARGRG